MDTGPNSVLLKKSEENRLEELFNTFARMDNKTLKFHEFMFLILDRTMLTNRLTFSMFTDLFNKVVGTDKVMSRQKFFYAVTLMAKMIYPAEKAPIETIFANLLTERPPGQKDQEIQKVIHNDEVNKRLLSEGCIIILCDYEKELQRVYCLYNADNIKFGKMMLTWKEISIQNKRMNTVNCIRMLREADVIPNLLSIENFSDILSKIVPPISFKEHAFFNNNIPAQIYEKDPNTTFDLKYDGDPHLYFHEFQLLLGRIGIEVLSRHTEKKEDEKNLKIFLSQNLMIRDNSEIETKELPQINRQFLKRLIQSYQPDLKTKKLMQQADANMHADLNILDNSDPITDAEPLNIDFTEIFKKLEKDLPPYPPELDFKQQNPPPYTNSKPIIGMPAPIEPAEKGAAQPKKETKGKPKKGGGNGGSDGAIEDRIPWADVPKPMPKTSYEVMADYGEALAEEDEGEELDGGILSNIDVAPTIIREIIYPHDMPQSVTMLIESSLISHNTSNFMGGITNLEKAKSEWLKELGAHELPEELNIFFEFQKGLIYESANRDDYAFNAFYHSKVLGDELDANNPDKALGFCGMGSVLYKKQEYKWALRVFLRAREIRETLLGPDAPDTATTYNNIACCFFMLERISEAYVFFELAHALYDDALGPFHYRTTTALRNFNKAKRASFQTKAPFSSLWEAYVVDKFPAKKGKGGKKKKGKQ